jgi:hypothetical protein
MPLVHTAKIIELVKPKIVGGRTDSAIMEITSKHWKKMVAVLLRGLFELVKWVKRHSINILILGIQV